MRAILADENVSKYWPSLHDGACNIRMRDDRQNIVIVEVPPRTSSRQTNGPASPGAAEPASVASQSATPAFASAPSPALVAALTAIAADSPAALISALTSALVSIGPILLATVAPPPHADPCAAEASDPAIAEDAQHYSVNQDQDESVRSSPSPLRTRSQRRPPARQESATKA